MDGIPLDETKKAAAKFVDSILNKNSNIGLVSYSDEATSLSGICSNDVFLKNTITSLSSAENTNIEDGLSRAYSMLQLGQSKKKLIVLMSDGLPTLGKDGEELIKYAEKIKDQGVLIYTLGFFQNTEEYKAEGQVFGIGCKIFTIAGPVILYGILSSWCLGIIYYILKMIGVAS